MPFSSAAVANAFLTRSFKEDIPIDPMKMQKLVYIAHGYVLVDHDAPLVDELFEAWTFGPVLPFLYHKCKEYRAGAITERVSEYDGSSRTFFKPVVPSTAFVAPQIDFTWENYKSERAVDLSAWTHEQGGPWDSARHPVDQTVVYRNQTISNDAIKRYFRANLYE